MKPLAAGVLILCALLGFAEGSGRGPRITWWIMDDGNQGTVLFRTLAEEYRASHPGLSIEITAVEHYAYDGKLRSALMRGEAPDVFHSWGGSTLSEYAEAGYLRDISPEVEGSAWGDSISSGAWKAFSVGGKVYGVPYDLGAVTVWYNKELLRKAGYESFPADYDGFLALVAALKDSGVAPIALGGADKWPAMHFWCYLALRLGGGELFRGLLDGSNPKGFADPAFIKASRMMADLAASGAFGKGFLSATYSDAATAMGGGKAAMHLQGQWEPVIERDSSADGKGIGDKLATAPFPAIKGGRGARGEFIGGGSGLVLGRGASDAAVDFLRYLSRPDCQNRLAAAIRTIPTVAGAIVPDPDLQAVKELVDGSSLVQLYLDASLRYRAASAVNDAVQALIAGTLSPEQACADMEAAFLSKAD